MPVRDIERLVNFRETTALLRCSVPTVWRRVADGSLPKPVKIGDITRWPEKEINAVIEATKAERKAA